MPVTDSEVGITEILGNHLPFRGVLKQNINDFIVNEVLLTGEVARLTSLPKFQIKEKKDESVQPKEDGQEKNEQLKEINDDVYAELDLLFPNTVSNPASTSIRDLIQREETQLTLPSCDKAERTKVHEWVRQYLPTFVTDTVDVNGTKAVRLRHKQLCRPWKRRRPNQSNQKSDSLLDNTFDPRETQTSGDHKQDRMGRNTYVSFVLWKKNRDTNEALTMLGRALRIPWNAFTYAGTKDKRAITTQLVQVRGISEDRLARANRSIASNERGRRSLVIGNVQIMTKPSKALGLGDLKGNKFTIVLRDCDFGEAGEPNVYTALNNLHQYGFVNYFGLQRFGSGVSATHETGFAMLRGDFEDVCNRILLPLKVGEGHGTDSKEGMRPERRNMVECLEKFARKDMSADEVLQRLPMWMNIERSIISSFKEDEGRGLKKYDYKKAFSKLPRNLRRIYAHAVQSFIWNAMASKRIQLSPPNSPERLCAICGDLVLKNSQVDDNDFNYSTSFHVVTKEEEASSKFSIDQVVIPVVGSEVDVPDAPYGVVARDILKSYNIDLSSRLTSEYGLKGTYRWLIAKPKDLDLKVVEYHDKMESLVPSEIELLLATESTKEKVNGKNDMTPKKNEGGDMETINGEKVEEPVKDGEKRKAVVLSFTLGCAEYATMLIRELTKKDSSTANQKAMQDMISKK